MVHASMKIVNIAEINKLFITFNIHVIHVLHLELTMVYGNIIIFKEKNYLRAAIMSSSLASGFQSTLLSINLWGAERTENPWLLKMQ